jgi:HAD superfamily hydrolase (TIGR01509 family)
LHGEALRSCHASGARARGKRATASSWAEIEYRVATVFPATLFDFNGVLVDDETVHRESFRDVLTPLGVEFTDQMYVDRYLGYDDVGAMRAMLVDAGRSPSDREIMDLARAKGPFYMRRAEQALIIFDGAVDVVRARAAKGPVGIVSGALRDEIAFALRRMKLEDAVSFVVSAEDTTRCKPDPMGYHLAIERLSQRLGAQDARRALVIEDSLAGIEAAKSAGLTCLAVAHSYSEADLVAAGADAVAPHISRVNPAFIDELYAKSHG